MALRDLKYFVRGRINRAMSRLFTRRAGPPPTFMPAPLEAVLAGPRTPLALTRLLESRGKS